MNVPFDRQIWAGQECADYLGIAKSEFMNYTRFINTFPTRLAIPGHPRWRALSVRDWFDLRKRCTSMYRHFDVTGRLLYVGIALSPLSRLRGHRVTASWFDDIASITVERFPDVAAARRAERSAVEQERPLFNRKLVRHV